jgi:hypothetical protein
MSSETHAAVPSRSTNPPRIFRELAALLAIGLLLLALLFSKLFVDPFFYFSTDNAELYFAWLVMLTRALHHGYWPFLNPYAFAGSLPFAALESGAMYPVTLLAAAVTNPRWSLDSIYSVFLGLSFLHYLLGALAMYVLLRRSFALGATSAMVGALSYAFGGSFLGRFSHQPVLYTLAWLPIAVGGAKTFTEGGTLRSGGLAVAAIWVMGACSHPQFFLYGFATVAAAVAWFSIAQDRALRVSALGRSVIVLALALGLLAPRVLPLIELARVTVRPISTYTIASLFDSLSPLYYLTLLAPGVFGRHMVGYWGSDHPLGNWGSLLYLGILPLLCACFAFVHERRHDWQFALLGTATTVLFMLGRHWTVSAWVNQHLPLSQALTDLSKLTIVFHFFLALLAAFGVQALLARRRRASIVLVAVAVGCAMIAIFAWLTPAVVARLAPAGRSAPSEEAVRFAVQSVHQARLVALLGLLTLLTAIVFPRVGRVLFVPVLVADLAFSLGHFNPIEVSKGSPSTYYGRDAATRVMQGDPDTFRVANMVPPNGGMVFALEAVWGYHTIQTAAYASIQRFFDVHDAHDRAMYNVANIKYHRLGSPPSSSSFTQVAPGLWMNRERLPRVFFVGRCRAFVDQEAMVGHSRSPSFDPTRELMLSASDCTEASAARGSCTLRSASESRERYDAECTVEDGHGWAFFSVVQYPGWTAVVDGHPADLVPANIGFYAVPLDLGRHRVELSYRSRGLVYGVWSATVAGILALGLVIWYARRPRKAFAP